VAVGVVDVDVEVVSDEYQRAIELLERVVGMLTKMLGTT